MNNDLMMSSSMKDFIKDTKDLSKVSSYLYKAIEGNHLVMRNLTAEKANYLTFRKDGTVSYLPAGRELKFTERGEWARDGRQEAKPARAITQIMRNAMLRSITSRDLEIFSNLYKGRATDLYNIQVTSGDGLCEVYALKAEGFSSCMNGGYHASKLRLYQENPNQVRIAYVQVNDKCLARALVWTANDGSVIMDRVYGSEEFQTMFKDYARDQGWWKKRCDSAGDSPFISPDGDNKDRYFTITLADGDFEYYPYVDTFRYQNGNELSNNEDFSIDTDEGYELTCTDGDRTCMGVECYNRSARYPISQCSWSEYHEMYVHDDDAVTIERTGEIFHREAGYTDEAIDMGGGEYILVSDCREAECFQVGDLDSDEEVFEIRNVSTDTYYKTPNDGYILVSEATIVNVFILRKSGEIQGAV